MGLFLNKKGAVPEVAAKPQEAMATMEQQGQEFPVAHQTPTQPVEQSQPKALPPVNYTPQQMPTQMQPPIPKQEQSNTTQNNLNQTASPSITTELSMGETHKMDQPFFVRIDKFNETMENFKRIFEQVQNIERIVESLELTKEEEEREIEEWKKDIEDMKKNLNKIDNEIFSKI